MTPSRRLPTTSPPPTATSHRVLMVLLGPFAFGLMTMTICIPSMLEWGAPFGAPQATVQLSFSGFVIAFGSTCFIRPPFIGRG